MRMSGLAAGFAAGLLAYTAEVSAAPTETGLHKLHAAARVGGKVCFVEHSHEGDGFALATRRGAEASAARKWSTFTADEYGTAWGSYVAAIAKSMTCRQGADKYWSCTARARPCRVGK